MKYPVTTTLKTISAVLVLVFFQLTRLSKARCFSKQTRNLLWHNGIAYLLRLPYISINLPKSMTSHIFSTIYHAVAQYTVAK